MKAGQLEKLIHTVQQELTRVYQVDRVWNGDRDDHPGSILLPPASPDIVSAFQKRSLKGKSLPPSYVEFLKLHNGWQHFWEDFTLMGVSGSTARYVLAEYREYKRDQEEFLREEMTLTPLSIEQWEAEDEYNMYLANHIPFGTNGAGVLYLFDTRTKDAVGEMNVAYWTTDAGAWPEERRNGFVDLLRFVEQAAPERYRQQKNAMAARP